MPGQRAERHGDLAPGIAETSFDLVDVDGMLSAANDDDEYLDVAGDAGGADLGFQHAVLRLEGVARNAAGKVSAGRAAGEDSDDDLDLSM